MVDYKNLEIWVVFHDDPLDVLVPQFWVNEGLYILRNNTIMPFLVNRDYEDQVQQFGDTVNAWLPGSFVAVTKDDSDNVTDQNATATKIPVVLNKHVHVSILIGDLTEAKTLPLLREKYLEPAFIAMAQKIDEALITECYNFYPNVVGKLGVAPTKTQVIRAREKLNELGVPMSQRVGVLSTSTEGDLLNEELFTSTEKRGDSIALQEGTLGRLFGIDFFMDQNVPNIASGSTVVTGAINNASGYAIGSTALTVDGFSAAISNGSWVTIAGDMTPQFITGTTGGATPTALAISPGLHNAVADDAVVTVYKPGAINNASGYAASYGKQMTVDGFSVQPKRGQLVSFGATASAIEIYGAISGLDGTTPTPTSTKLELNKGLISAVADDAVIGLGPAGKYNPIFHRNAITFAARPLPLPPESTGARSARGVLNGIPIRFVTAYDSKAQKIRVTIDTLFGLRTLNKNMGCLILG